MGIVAPVHLILSASVGAGHVRAAEAIELALQEIAPGLMLKNVDILSLASSAFRRIYGKGYLDVARRAPHLLGYVYDLLDRPHRFHDAPNVGSTPVRALLRGRGGERSE